MKDKLSICITLKNRAALMLDKLHELVSMNFDPKRLEICVTDGGSTDGLVDVLKGAAHKFDQIKYAISDRSVLPFLIPTNNPACDINAQICNVASYDKIVRTDAEVRFRNKNSLKLIDDVLNRDKEICLCFRMWHMSPKFRVGIDDPKQHINSSAKLSFHCSCFWKAAFIRNRGVEEAYAKGFAAEDSYFHNWWRKNRRLIHSPAGHEVLHLWHGLVMTGPNVKLKHEYTMPLYKKMLAENRTPNLGNDAWQRPEMIKGVQIWK